MSSHLHPGLYRAKNGSLVEILKEYPSAEGPLFVGVVLESEHITELTPWLWFRSGEINGSQTPDEWKLCVEVTRELYVLDTCGNVYVEGTLYTRRGSESFRKIKRKLGGEDEKDSGAGP